MTLSDTSPPQIDALRKIQFAAREMRKIGAVAAGLYGARNSIIHGKSKARSQGGNQCIVVDYLSSPLSRAALVCLRNSKLRQRRCL